MLITKCVIIKWHPTTIERYTELGYRYTKTGQPFEVRIEDLAKSSHVKVSVQCDYCQEIFETTFDKYNRARDSSPTQKDSCNKCKTKKGRETNIEKYGVAIPMHREEVAAKVADQRRLNFEEVEAEFEKRDLRLISGKVDYRTNKSKLRFICPKHEEYGIQEIDWNHFKQRNQDCKGCGWEKQIEFIQSLKMDFSTIRQAFEERGYQLLSDASDYDNNESKLKYICPKHPNRLQEITWGHFNSGQGCRYCAYNSFRGENNPNWNGGRTEISYYLRPSATYEWRTRSLEQFNHTCDVSGGKFEKDDEVHHLSKSFTEIFSEMLELLDMEIKQSVSDYSEAEITMMKEKIAELHDYYGIGVPLKKKIHDLYHKIYGRGNPSIKTYEEFKSRFRSEEFVD